MLRLGEFQTLKVIKKVDFGVYLAEDGRSEDKVLLPNNQLDGKTEIGDEINVFIYKDSSDRIIATGAEPLLSMGEVAALTVREVTKIGAFLDWGLEKDLFLPYREMTDKLTAGRQILVRLYIDKSNRLCASMKHLYDMLHTRSPYNIGDEVEGRIYEFGHDFGTFVAVDDVYSAMIPKYEDMRAYHIGDVIKARVTGVKEDGKLDITMRQKAHLQIDDDAGHIMEIIDSYGGVLPFSEKADPAVIARETGLSKAAFKRAVGHLYKSRLISITDGRIRKIQ
ncbi:MAG: RNA-binding protein [Lachnospiraceae bacterium]|nr:RNA-binding protein [Lachnospiraceae bacterium]